MSDDDTRELTPLGASPDDEHFASPDDEHRAVPEGEPTPAEEVTAAPGAGATGTTEEDETVTIDKDVPAAAQGDDATVPLPRAEDATVPLPKAEDVTVPLPPAAAAGTPPRPAPPADAYATSTGHIRVMSPAAPAVAAPEPPRTLRVGTVVWGLVVMAVGVGLLSVAWGAHLDTELAFIVLLGAAGVALLVGSLVGMRRSRHRLEGRG